MTQEDGGLKGGYYEFAMGLLGEEGKASPDYCKGAMLRAAVDTLSEASRASDPASVASLRQRLVTGPVKQCMDEIHRMKKTQGGGKTVKAYGEVESLYDALNSTLDERRMLARLLEDEERGLSLSSAILAAAAALFGADVAYMAYSLGDWVMVALSLAAGASEAVALYMVVRRARRLLQNAIQSLMDRIGGKQ